MKKIFLLIFFIFSAHIIIAQDLNLVWGKTMNPIFAPSAVGIGLGRAVDIGTDGSIYTTGLFASQSVDFDPGVGVYTLSKVDSTDIFIQKLTPQGTFVWAKAIGGIGRDVAFSLGLDANDNVYITGYFAETVDFDPSAGVFNLTSNGKKDAFILKLNSNGDFLWAKNIGGVDNDMALKLILDNAGNLFVTGNFMGSVDFDPNAGTNILSSIGSGDAFVIKMDSNGNLIWAKQSNIGGNGMGMAITKDASQNIYITGIRSETGSGSYTFYSSNPWYLPQGPMFLQKIDNNTGNLIWENITSLIDSPHAMVVDNVGNIYTAGGTVVLYALKTDSNGNLLWYYKGTGSNNYLGRSIAIDNNNDLYLTGSFQGTVDADLTTQTYNLTSTGNFDIYLIKMDSNANLIWAKNMGGNGGETAYHVKVDVNNQVYLTGDIDSGVSDLDPNGVFNVSGGASIFVAKYTQGLPTPTTNLTGSLVSSSYANLNWDNVIGESGYKILRSTTSGGPYTEVGTQTFNVTNFQNYGLSSNTTYYYVVRVVNTNGESTNSNEISITTPNKLNQSINFQALPNRYFGDAPFALSATATSNLPISYTSSNTSIATISGNTVTIVGVGTTNITASQAGNTDYNPATSVVRSFTVEKGNQFISFDNIPNKIFGDAPFALSATVNSGLTLTYSSSNTSVATVSGNIVTIVGAGTTNITASQAGNANYNPASTFRTLVVDKANQVINFETLSDKTFGDASFALTATGGNSGNPVTYTSSNTSVAWVSGSTVNIVGAGTTNITASQAGNANYNPATSVIQPLLVNKANQTITFNPLVNKTFGNSPFTLGATSSSNLSISYISSNTSVATISGNTVTIVGVGTTNITASQTGNANYNPATSVIQPLLVEKANQTITFNSLPNKTFGDTPFTVSATGGASGNPVTFSSSNPLVATISGNTVTIIGAGTTNITASQAGNANYNPATSAIQPLLVNKASQTITFSPLPNKTFGDASFTLTATGGVSGNPVTFSSSNTLVATVSGNTVTIVGAGTTNITASQAGNDNYNPTDIIQPLVVNRANQTITFEVIPAKTFSGTPESFTLKATSSVGLPVQFGSSNTSVISVSGNTATILGIGIADITAFQNGNTNYNAANSKQTISIILSSINGVKGNDILLYPNPTSDIVYIQGLKQLDVDIHLINAQGVEMPLLNRTIINSNTIAFDASSLPVGLYFMKITDTKEQAFSIKIIKK